MSVWDGEFRKVSGLARAECHLWGGGQGRRHAVVLVATMKVQLVALPPLGVSNIHRETGGKEEERL